MSNITLLKTKLKTKCEWSGEICNHKVQFDFYSTKSSIFSTSHVTRRYMANEKDKELLKEILTR